MKTIKHILLILWAFFVATFLSCAPRAYPPGPNPLDAPGSTAPTTAGFHTSHLRAITGNPAHP